MALEGCRLPEVMGHSRRPGSKILYGCADAEDGPKQKAHEEIARAPLTPAEDQVKTTIKDKVEDDPDQTGQRPLGLGGPEA